VTADTTENGFVAGLTSGWNALLDFLRWVGTAVGGVLPFLPLVAVAGLIGWWLVRRRPRGRGVAGTARVTLKVNDPPDAADVGRSYTAAAPTG
jgi:hypothetical protein